MFRVLFGRLALVALVTFAAGRRLQAQDAGTARVDFAGAWAIDPKASDDPLGKLAKEFPPVPGAGTDASNPRSSGRNPDWFNDLPLEATIDAHRVVITRKDDELVLVYPSGRKRRFFPDGEERELDDGDGPARVVAKRRGPSTILVSSRWSNGTALTETWALSPDARRLLVSAKVKSRHSVTYQRVYDPAPPDTPTPVPTLTPTPGPEPSPAPGTTPGSVAIARMGECSVRPPRGTEGAELVRLARITPDEARKKAEAAVAPARIASVISSDVEVDEGCLVYPFDLRLADKTGGVQEVLIDAGDGRVLSSKFEATGH